MRGRGVSPVPLIAFIFLFVLFLALTFVVYKQREETMRLYERSGRDLAEIENDIQDKEKRLRKISNLTGFHQPIEQDGILQTSSDALIQKLNRVCSDEEAYGTKQYFGVQGLVSQEILAENLVDENFVQSMTKMEQVWEEYSKRIDQLKESTRQKEKQLQSLRDEYEKALQSDKDDIQKLQREIQQKRSEIAKFRETKEKELKDEEESRREAQVAKAEEKERVAELKKDLRGQQNKYQVDFDNLDQRIEELQAEAEGQTGIERFYQEKPRKKEQDAPDGEIIHISENLKIAYIDLGKTDGILPGLKFDVFRYVKGGEKWIKGQVEVKKVYGNRSMVGILKVTDELAPITRGDKIINPVYDRNKTTYFVIAGDLVQKYSKQQASRLVEQLGGKVEDRITAKTDFIILGEGFEDDPVYKRSVELGIETMLETEFINYLDK